MVGCKRFVVSNSLETAVTVRYINCNDATVSTAIAYTPNGSPGAVICAKSITLDPDTNQYPAGITVEASYHYQLTNCQDPLDIVYSDNIELEGAVNNNEIIKLVGDSRCWTVEYACDKELIVITPDLEVYKCYTTCEACLPVVTPPIVPKQRVQDPGYNPGVCNPEYLERVKCTLGEIHHKEMLNKRFGITNCCPEEDEKWFIKNELLNLELITDPTLCIN